MHQIPLVVLMAIHYEVHIWYFTLEHVNEQRRVVEHVHVVVDSTQRNYQIHKSYEATISIMMVVDPIPPLVNCLLHLVRQFLHFQFMQSMLSNILEISCFSPSANNRVGSSTVEWWLYSSTKHEITPLHNSLRHSKEKLPRFDVFINRVGNATIDKHMCGSSVVLMGEKLLLLSASDSSTSDIFDKIRAASCWSGVASTGCGRLHDADRYNSDDVSFTSSWKTRRQASSLHPF